MKILQMLPALKSGGVETGTIDVSRALKKMGHEVYVMSSGGEMVKELVKAGIPHVTLPVHRKSLTSLLLVKTVRDFISRNRIDVVHARSRVPAWIGFLAARGTGAVFVTTCHGYYSTHAMSRVMGWGKEVIVISKIIGRHMSEDFRVPSERLHLVYRGVDLSRYPFEAKSNAAEKREKFIVVNIGRLTPIKGHPHFIRSICLAAMHIPGLEAWIVGDCEEGKEDYRAELERLVLRFGLQGRVCFLGRRNDIPEILRKADVLALTTNAQEGFGRVLIEAGARGTPVVSTRVGGVSEIIEHEKDGILVQAGNDEALARALVDLWRHPEKRESYARSLRQKIENCFSLDTMTEKTVQVYGKALSRKKILILKLGSLGDLILAVPSFRALKKRFPDSETTLVVDSRWYSVAKTIPYLDRIMTYERHAGNRWRKLWRLANRLRKEGFDFSLDFQNNSKTHLLAFLAQVPRRYGYRRKWTGSLLTHAVSFEAQGISPVSHQFRLLQLLGITEMDDRLELWPEEEAEKKIEALFAEHWINSGQRLIGFSLSASPKWPTKNWPAGRFLELAKKVNEKFNARVILIGGNEAALAGRLFDRERLPFVINLVGKTKVGEWISLIKRLDLLVTADSAPMHVAAACGTKFVALFGPTDPKRHLPPAKNFAVLRKSLSCAPCYSGYCKVKEFLCMPSIECGEVFQRIEQLLAIEKEPLKI